jgi:hypothetical protein
MSDHLQKENFTKVSWYVPSPLDQAWCIVDAKLKVVEWVTGSANDWILEYINNPIK